MSCEGNGCLGLSLGRNGFGPKLKHPTQVDVEDGCLGLAHGKDFGLKLEPRPKVALMKGSMPPMLATLMAQVHVKLAYLVSI